MGRHLDRLWKGAYVKEEDDHHRGQYDCRTPCVFRPSSCHTDTCLRSDGTVGRVKKVYEGGGNDDASAEVSSEEVDVDGDAEAGDTFRDDGEEGRAAGTDEDDEEGGHSGAELAVVLVFADGHGADYLVEG